MEYQYASTGGDEKDCGEAQLKDGTELVLVNGVDPEVSGLYQRTTSGFGLYDRVEGQGFIYTDYSSETKELVIGSGKRGFLAKAIYRSQGGTSDISTAVWERTAEIGTRFGKGQGNRDTAVRVISVPGVFHRSILENSSHYETETSIPEIGLICLVRRGGSTELEKTFISFKNKAGGRCDGIPTCQHGGDEKDCQEASLNHDTEMILVNGVRPDIGGLYQKTKSGIGLYDKVGGGGFLYTDQQSDKKRLVLGQGDKETAVSATARYKTKEGTKDIGDAVWEYVVDGTRSGKPEGARAPRVKVIPVPDAFDKSTLENNENYEEEKSIPDIGVICLTRTIGSEDLEQTFIPFNDQAAGWCDATWHCQYGGNSVL